MTTKEINGEKYLFAEVPEGSGGFQIIGRAIFYLKETEKRKYLIELEEGNYKIVGKPSLITNEVWKDLLPIVEYSSKNIGYEDYTDPEKHFGYWVNGKVFQSNAATQSGLSLIQSLGMKPEQTLILKLLK